MPARADALAPRLRGVRRPYGLQALLAAVGLLAGGAGVVQAVRAIRVDPAAAHGVRVAGLSLAYPAMNGASVLLLVVAALGAVSLVRMAGAAYRSLHDQRALAAHLRAVAAETLRAVVDGVPVAVHVFADERREAFCLGLLRPQIHVSTGAVAALDEPALRAVIAHEREHQLARDPLRAFAGSVLARSLFFLPVLERLLRTGELLAELRADDRALVSSGRDGAPLASAMLTMSPGAGEGTRGVGAHRVDHLLGHPVRPRLPWALTALGLLTLATMIAVLWRAWRAASISATFSLPLLSRQPCVLALALVPMLCGLCLVALRASRRR